MTLLRGLGDRAAALRAYEAFAFRLTQEYELEPSAETRALAEAMRRDEPTAVTAAPPEPSSSSSQAPGRELRPPRRSGVLVPLLAFATLLAALGLGVVVQHRSAAASTSRRLAVLPLENLTGDSTQNAFVDGLQQGIIDEFSKIEAVSAVSRASVLRYRDSTRLRLREIARQLSVEAVVRASVSRSGDSMRVAVQLFDGRSDRPLWTQTYVRERRDVLRLSGELASDVVGQIRGAITPAERGRLARERQVDPDVYTLTFKGGHECLLWTDGGLRRGIQLLRDAVDRDPTNALAYAKLAGCYADMSLFEFMPDSEAAPLVQAANARALELDSTVGEAYVTRGWFRFVTDHDTDGADQDFRRALELSPGDLRTRQWYADYLTLTGRFDQAISEKRQAIAVDPLSAQSSIGLGWTYFYARRYDEAIAQFRRTLNLAPGSYSAHMQLAWNYSLKDVHDVAVAHCDSAFALVRQADNNWPADCGWVYARAGRRAQVLEMLRRIPEPCGAGAGVYVALGDPDHALDCLRKEGRENPQNLAFENFNPMLDPLRSDPRSHAVLRELGIKP
jgi:TolB-like protein/Tfp pilus assembly protein PilF